MKYTLFRASESLPVSIGGKVYISDLEHPREPQQRHARTLTLHQYFNKKREFPYELVLLTTVRFSVSVGRPTTTTTTTTYSAILAVVRVVWVVRAVSTRRRTVVYCLRHSNRNKK